MIDTWNDFINVCIGLWQGGAYLDKIEKDFRLKYSNLDIHHEEDIKELITLTLERGRLGDAIASRLFDAVIERAVEELGANEEDFDKDCNGIIADLYYKGQVIADWAELEEILSLKETEE